MKNKELIYHLCFIDLKINTYTDQNVFIFSAFMFDSQNFLLKTIAVYLT